MINIRFVISRDKIPVIVVFFVNFPIAYRHVLVCLLLFPAVHRYNYNATGLCLKWLLSYGVNCRLYYVAVHNIVQMYRLF